MIGPAASWCVVAVKLFKQEGRGKKKSVKEKEGEKVAPDGARTAILAPTEWGIVARAGVR